MGDHYVRLFNLAESDLHQKQCQRIIENYRSLSH